MAWLYKQKGSKNWWLGYRVGGKQVLRSTGTPDRKEAEKQLAQVQTMFAAKRTETLTEELFRLLTGKTVTKLSLKAALEDWLSECDGTTSFKTYERYEAVATGFAEHFGSTDKNPLLNEIDTKHVRSYLTKKRKKLSAASVNLERKILSVFFGREVKLGNIDKNPVLAIKTLKQEDSLRRRPFTLKEIELMYSRAPDEFWRFMILAGFYIGARLGDLTCLVWPQIDFENNQVHIKARKTGVVTHVPIAPRLRLELNQLAKRRVKHDPDYLFPEHAEGYLQKRASFLSNEFYDLVLTPCGLVVPRTSKAAQKSGRNANRNVNDVSFHSLRHSFVTYLKVTGAGQSIAKALAGHNSDTISDLYTTLPPEALTKAINQLPEVGG